MAQVIEERVSRLEGVVEQMNERLGKIESDIAGLRGEMNSLRGEMSSLRQDMNTSIAELGRELHANFRWTMGTIIVMWVTIICAVLFA